VRPERSGRSFELNWSKKLEPKIPMHRLFALTSRYFPAGLLALTLAACHDAPRSNPLDPATTPPVELEVTTPGIATAINTLTWTPYAGAAPFAAYWVLRSNARILEQVDTLDVQSDYYWVLRNTVRKVDTLAVFADPRRISFVDTIRAGDRLKTLAYRISVINTGGFEVTSEEKEPVEE
jgi:hypothetical protein